MIYPLSSTSYSALYDLPSTLQALPATCTLCTLRSTLETLHIQLLSTLCDLSSTLQALPAIHCTLGSTLYELPSKLYQLLCNLHSTPYNLPCTRLSVVSLFSNMVNRMELDFVCTLHFNCGHHPV